MNKVILIGNIATDIDLQYTPNGNAVAKFNLAVNDRDDTTFIPVEVWKRQAENLSNYQSKGSKVAVDGSIKIDKWEKDGQKRSFTKVLAFSIEYLDSKKDSEPKKTLESESEPQPTNSDDLPF